MLLQPDIDRIAHSPTAGEKIEDVDTIESEILNMIETIQ